MKISFTATEFEREYISDMANPYDQYEDRRIRGAAEQYCRAHAWGHLPPMMEFSTFLAALDRGDDPFLNDLLPLPAREGARG